MFGSWFGASDAKAEPNDPINDRVPSDKEMASGFGTLFALDSATNQFDPLWEECEVVLTKKTTPVGKSKTLSYASTFEIYVGDRCKCSAVASPDLQMQFDRTNHSLVWPGKIHDRMQVLSFKFDPDNDEEDDDSRQGQRPKRYAFERQFKLAYAVACYENSTQGDFSKAITSEEDRRWVHDAYETDMEIDDDHQDMDDLDFDNEYADASEGFLNECADSHNSSAKFMKAANKPWPRSAIKRSRPAEEVNNILSAAISRNRAFVVRGSKIGYFNVDTDGGMQYCGKLPVVTDKDGQPVAPSQALLHDRDSKMLMLRSNDKRQMVDVDLETGKIVEEFQAKDDKKVNSITEMQKYNQSRNEQVFMGLNERSKFVMDQRVNGKNKQVVDHTYKGDVDLSCSATTGDGYIAVGSGKGAIRMFTKVAHKQAKTLLPGLGAPITNIDVTEDSSWILCTTDKFLLCVPTRFTSKLGNFVTGFADRMGDQKPVPFKLQLKPADIVKYSIDNVEFTSAKFNIGDNIEEQWIVTSTGPYLITWNFRKVKQGIRDEYKIKMADDTVMADQFRYNLDDQVVVALPDRVQLHARHMRNRVRN